VIRRRLLAPAVLLLAAGCGASGGPTNTSTPTPTPSEKLPVLVTTRCADVIVLGLRGSDQAMDRNHGSGQEILRSVRAMSVRLHRTSRATVRLEGIPYRAQSAANATIYQGNIDDGATRTRDRLAQLATRCPASRIALVGFSQGAQAVHQLVTGPPVAGSARIVLVAMIADPRRNPDDPIGSWTYGAKVRGSGKLGPGPLVPRALRDRTLSFCATGDEICNWPAGGYTGPLSDTHRHFYETPKHARSTGRQLAGVLLRHLPRDPG
jgi:cutinase